MSSSIGSGICEQRDPPAKRLLIGDILRELGYVTADQVHEALDAQQVDKELGKTHRLLGQILLDMGYCQTYEMVHALQLQCELRQSESGIRA